LAARQRNIRRPRGGRLFPVKPAAFAEAYELA
jgi:hypothetical protein